MDKVLSARVDEAVIDQLDRACKRLGTTKKRFLEDAIRQRAATIDPPTEDVWSETSGAWARRESPGSTIRATRKAFEESMARSRPRPRQRAGRTG